MVGFEDDIQASRFRALLNPIRDLAASWDFDVAKELTDYAISLGIDIEGDADLDTDAELPSVPVDFAEAALLVQGSTSIYSRKVEHLYGLVYKAVAELNLLRGKDKASGNGTTEPESQDPDADKLLDVDKIDFLDLHDAVEPADEKAITLQEKELPPAGSLQDATTLRPIPRMLMRGNTEQSNLERSNLKMLTAHTHPSGALIMEGCPPVTEDLTTLPTTDNAASLSQLLPVDDDDDRENDFPSLPDHDDDAGYSTPPPMSSAPYDNDDILVGIASSAKKKGRGPRLIPAEPKKRAKPKKDPFLMLDPHEPIPSLEKPLRVGKTYRKPRISKNTDAHLQNTVVFDEGLDPDLNLTFGILDPIPSGASIRSYLCFEGLRRPYREVLRRRLALKRRNAFESNRLVDQAIAIEKEDEDLEAEIPSADAAPQVSLADGDDFPGGCFDDDPNDFPPFPSLDDNENDDIEGGVNEAFESGRRFSEQFERMASEYQKVCREHLQKTAQLWQQRAADADLLNRVKIWESRIRPLMEEEELRPEFDITTYGQTVVNRLTTTENSTRITERRLKPLFQARERYEVCRFFLATLQLANTYTVEIVSSNTSGVSDPSVKLLAAPANEAEKNCTPVRSKRSRQPGTTPKSARRPPLRSRLQV